MLVQGVRVPQFNVTTDKSERRRLALTYEATQQRGGETSHAKNEGQVWQYELANNSQQ